MNAIELIAKERQEQVEKHGFDSVHDDEHGDCQLEQAAISIVSDDPDMWPWQGELDMFHRISRKSPIDRLVIAASFLAAEIDRLIRETGRCQVN